MVEDSSPNYSIELTKLNSVRKMGPNIISLEFSHFWLKCFVVIMHHFQNKIKQNQTFNCLLIKLVKKLTKICG